MGTYKERPAGAIEVILLTPGLKEQAVGVIVEAFKTEETTTYHLDMEHAATVRRYVCLVDTFLELYLAAGRPLFAAVLDGRVVGMGMVRDPRRSITAKSVISTLLPRLPRLTALFSKHPIKALRIIRAASHPKGMTKPYFTFEVLGVHPDCQGKGIGRQIMEEVQSFAAEDPTISGIYLNTGSVKNQEFYERRGYLTLKVVDLDVAKVYHMFWQNPAFGQP